MEEQQIIENTEGNAEEKKGNRAGKNILQKAVRHSQCRFKIQGTVQGKLLFPLQAILSER